MLISANDLIFNNIFKMFKFILLKWIKKDNKKDFKNIRNYI